MSEEEEFEFNISDELRKAVHDEGFFCDDEIRKDNDGGVWVKMDFFKQLKKFMDSFLGGEDNGEV